VPPAEPGQREPAATSAVATAPRILPFGDVGLLVEMGGEAGIMAARRARVLASAIVTAAGEGAPALTGIGQPVAGATSVLVPLSPTPAGSRRRWSDPESVGAALLALAAGVPADPPAPPDAREHVVAVRYGGSDGEDLASVAAEAGLAPDDVVDMHAATPYEVLFLGFAPGFGYLGVLPAQLRLPRLATPRVVVPAGSVAIAGSLTAVYPQASPGGWRLLGRTDACLFDPTSARPALLRPGDRVRFTPS
jgi:KipI family sensor histidine kinase inhibitor